jgi:hypothetical protein
VGSDLYIQGPHPLPGGVAGLTRAVEAFFGPASEITATGGDFATADAWNIDVELTDGAEPQLDEWVERLLAFLRKWPVPPGTWVQVVPPDWGETGRGSREYQVDSDWAM